MENRIAIIGDDLADIRSALKDSDFKPQVLELAPAAKPATRGAPIALNRKQRRAAEKQRRSNLHQKKQAQHLERVRKQMQAQIDAQKAAEALNDVPFGDPRNIAKINKVFDPLVLALNKLRADGEINVMPDGTALLWIGEDGCYYPAAESIDSVTETYEKLGEKYGWNDHNDGLRVIANRLRADEPIAESELTAANKTIEWLKFCTMTITPRQFSEVALTVQIRAEAKEQGLVE